MSKTEIGVGSPLARQIYAKILFNEVSRQDKMNQRAIAHALSKKPTPTKTWKVSGELPPRYRLD